MALTVLPPRKTALGEFTEGMKPYLQMAMQMAMQRKAEERKFEHEKELANIKSQSGLSGYMIDAQGNAVPVYKGGGGGQVPGQQFPTPSPQLPTQPPQPPIPPSVRGTLGMQQPYGDISMKGGFRPEGFKDPYGMQYKYKPGKEERREEIIEKGRGKGTEEAFKQAEGQKRAFKKIASITRQFNEALPSGSKTAVEQRLSGLISVVGAQLGVKINPQLMALKKTAKLQLRSILRDMGEGARLSDQDITQNIALIEQEGLTDEERKALVRSFMQTAIDSMDSDTLTVIKEDASAVEELKAFGVNLDVGQVEENDGITSSGMGYTIER